MARRARLSVAAVPHLVLQRGHDGSLLARDDADADRLVQLLREAAAHARVALHAYALDGAQLMLLATPDTPQGVSRMMQALGRQYAAWFNRRHARTGSLWDGRFRSALVEPGPTLLLALRVVDGAANRHPAPAPDDAGAEMPPAWGDAALRGSAGSRTGGPRDPALVDPREFWQLGNTPFERESRYRRLLAEAPDAQQLQRLQQALRAGTACGSAAFLAGLAEQAGRALVPRPRGRPRKPAVAPS